MTYIRYGCLQNNRLDQENDSYMTYLSAFSVDQNVFLMFRNHSTIASEGSPLRVI